MKRSMTAMISVNKLTLKNIQQIEKHEIETDKIKRQYSGEIWLDDKMIGQFSENYFEEPVIITFLSNSDAKKAQSICNRYFKRYPPIVEGINNSVEAMITELLILTVVQENNIVAKAVLFTLKETLVYDISSEISMEDIVKNISIEYPDKSDKVKVFKIEADVDLKLIV